MSDDATEDAAPFDSVPGAGFDSSPLAAAIVPPAGTITGTGPAIAIDRAQNNAFRAVNAAWTAGARVRVDAAATFRRSPGWRMRPARRLVESLALQAERPLRPAPSWPGRGSGLYQPWNASMDAGWTQWLLENYGFDFSAVRPADVKAGALRDRFDVLIIADENARSLLDGFQPGAVPAPFPGRHGHATACRRSTSSSGTAARWYA